MANKFSLNQCFVSALILTALPASAYAAAVARVDFSIGDVVSTEPKGTTRSLPKGAQVSVGELINTNSGRAQLRFTDGAFMSLQPRTEFRVDNYKFDGKNDGSERGSFSLLSGGIRVITGLVGRGNRDNYQLNTATGVLGVRGTEYSVSYGNSISITVAAGEIQFCNSGGCLVGTSGQTIYVADFNTQPVIVDIKTDLQPAPPSEPKQSFMTTEDRTTGGGLAVVPPPPPSTPPGPGAPPETLLTAGTSTLNLAFAHNDNADIQGQKGDSHAAIPTSVTLDASLRMTAFQDTTPPSGPVTWNGGHDTAPNVSGNDGIIAWNRWAAPGVTGPIGGGGYHSNLTMAEQDGLHYVVGVPTPQADLNALRIANVTATYDLLGATRPSSRIGDTSTTGTLLPSSFLFVNFGTSRVTATLDVQTAAGIYNVVGTNLPIVGSGFSSALGGLTTFNSPPTCPPSDCSASIDGFFAGRNASRAGVSYSIREPERQTAGAAAFKRQGF